MNALTCNQNSTERKRSKCATSYGRALWELVEVKKKKNTQDSHLNENAAKNTKKMRSMATPKSQRQPSLDTNSDQMNTKKPVAVIAEDSLIKNVQGWRVSKGMKVKTVVVKAFPGSSVEDMFDYIKPTIKHHPQEIILHVGTNDLKNSGSRKIAERIVDLANFIEAKLTISNL